MSFEDYGTETWSGCANECRQSHFSWGLLYRAVHVRNSRNFLEHAAPLPWNASEVVSLFLCDMSAEMTREAWSPGSSHLCLGLISRLPGPAEEWEEALLPHL